MGWTGTYNVVWKNGRIDRKATLEAIIDGWFKNGKNTLLKGSLVGTTYYAAVRTEATQEVWGLVVLTSTQGAEFCYKEMDETEGPNYYGCPASILNLLTPTDCKWAQEWREKCRQNKDGSDNNKIPRNFEKIIMEQKTETSGGTTGDVWEIMKSPYYGLVGRNTRTGSLYRISLPYLRNKNFCTIVSIA